MNFSNVKPPSEESFRKRIASVQKAEKRARQVFTNAGQLLASASGECGIILDVRDYG